MTDKQTIVLLVDDEPANIDLLKGILPSEYKIKAAISGDRALKIAQKEPYPDVILLDVMMPEMDGFEVCRRLKADAPTAGIPVVFVSGHTDDEQRQKGLSLGAAAFIGKPIDPQVVNATVKSILGES